LLTTALAAGLPGMAAADLTIDPSKPALVAAESTYQRGKHAAAFRLFETLAKTGDVTAMDWVAFLYSRGEGVRQDYAAALDWYRKAAATDDSYATGEIGRFYEQGLGVAIDYAEAMKWYRAAADLDDAWALAQLADLYRDGMGVPQDYAEARRLWPGGGAGQRGGAGQPRRPQRQRLGRAAERRQGADVVSHRRRQWRSLRAERTRRDVRGGPRRSR
jgi:hypothetical protein